LGIVSHVARLDPKRVVGGTLARGLDLAPERLLVQVVVPCEAGEVLARALAEHPSRESPPCERSVDAAEWLDPDEITKGEDVQRDLEAELAVDVACGMGALARLVVLDDPACAERIDVDPVDLPGQIQIVRERKAALQLGRRSLRAERNLEPARD